MSHGRKSTIISARVDDSVYARIKSLADKEGLTVSEWVKTYLTRSAGLLPEGTVRSHHKKHSVDATTSPPPALTSSGVREDIGCRLS